VDHTVAETAFVQQFQLHADIVGEGLYAASTTMDARNRWHSSTNPACDLLGTFAEQCAAAQPVAATCADGHDHAGAPWGGLLVTDGDGS